MSKTTMWVMTGAGLLALGSLCAMIGIGYLTGVNAEQQASLRIINSVCTEMCQSTGQAPKDTAAIADYWEAKQTGQRFLEQLQTGQVRYYRLSEDSWLLMNTSKPIALLAIERRIEKGTPIVVEVWQKGRTSTWNEDPIR